MSSQRIKIKSTEKIKKEETEDRKKKIEKEDKEENPKKSSNQKLKEPDIDRDSITDSKKEVSSYNAFEPLPEQRRQNRYFDEKLPTADELEKIENASSEGPKWGYFSNRPKYQLVPKSQADEFLQDRNEKNIEKKSTQKEFEEKFDKLYGSGAKKEKSLATRAEAVVLLLDCSGSMSEPFGPGSKIDALKYAVSKFFERKELIKDMDYVGVVGYGLKGDKRLKLGSEGGVLNPYSPVVIISNLTRDYRHILQNINAMLRAEDGTPMEDGLVVAYNLLREFQTPVCQHRIILMSDGKAEDAKSVRMRAMKIASFGVVIDTISMGNQENIDEATLIEIANLSKGEYRYAADVETLWQTYDYLATKKPL